MATRRRYATKAEAEARGYYSRPALREMRLKPSALTPYIVLEGFHG